MQARTHRKRKHRTMFSLLSDRKIQSGEPSYKQKEGCRKKWSRSAYLLIGLFLLGLPHMADASPMSIRGKQQPVHIDPGPLETALHSFAHQTGVDLHFSSAETDGLHSSGLSGHLHPEEGLTRLAQEHGFRLIRRSANSFELVHGQNRTIMDSSTAMALPPILVMGEKVERSIQDTSSSVQVFDSRRIETAVNATEISDLLKMTPNIVDVGYGNHLPTVRGLDGAGPATGAVAFLAGTRPRLNVSLDGRSLTFNELAFGPQSLWDVGQVDIFLGPQSYMQGRNSIAGAVVLRSNEPSFAWEGAVKGSVGEQGYSQMAAMASGPIVEDQLAFRISADRQKRKSFVLLESYEPAGDPREFETTTLRTSLLYLPPGSPGLLTRFSVNHFDTRAPQGENMVAPPGTGSKLSGPRPVFETRSTSTIWDVEWEMSEGLRTETKIIYTDFDIQRITTAADAHADIEGREIQIEPTLHFQNSDGRLRGLAGLRYFRSSQDEFVNIFNGSNFDDKTETGSVYGEITYALLPRMDVTLGGRLEREQRKRKGGSKGIHHGGQVYSVEVDFDKTYSAFLPKLDLAWKVSPDHTLGAKVARGYRSGGAGITFDTPWTSFAFDEESVWNYELYSRHRLRDGQLELTSNIFFNNYEDMQLPYYINANAITIINAEKAQSYGAEMGVRWLPVSSLELFGGMGLLHTEIKRFSVASYEGNELPRAPSFSANMGACYRFASRFELSGSLSYKNSYYSYYDNDARGKISAYWMADLQLAYQLPKGRMVLFASNLMDKDHVVMISDNDMNAPVKTQPRMLGASLEWRF
ncbi:TonB-dependent receptor [Desulfobotulus sp. H1]|uniref:TonB-dependent receptor n=1 Tax=Desulfobotulus pelophilus TaxID=2823377 RepID=A0ABT3N8W5_9BACT|nr:TonB-dependent receptor [Desulfobotulus pelophilus]MCW7753889.1 TonB-dependent receptor [Desulfobotulus pelophilus]